MFVQRRDPNGLSGWLAYSFGRLRYSDTVTAETFWGDLEQRHALNAYASYRVSTHWNLGAKFRIGSNFPVPGYYREEDGVQFIAETRNELRLPVYARLDACEPDVHLDALATDALRRGHQCSRPRQRACKPAIDRRPDVAGTPPVRDYDSHRALCRRPD